MVRPRVLRINQGIFTVGTLKVYFASFLEPHKPQVAITRTLYVRTSET